MSENLTRLDLVGPALARALGDRAIADALVDTLADLHAVDPAAVGLTGFGRPSGLGERQVRRWSEQWERSGADARAEHASRLPAPLLPGRTVREADRRRPG